MPARRGREGRATVAGPDPACDARVSERAPSPEPDEPERRQLGPFAAEPWMVAVARLGYLVRGLVFAGIGLAGAAVAIGLSERPRGAVGVIRAISRLPLGDVMLVAVAAGLLGYAMLSFAGAIRDPYAYGGGPRGWAMRGADVGVGALYVALAAAALRLLAEPGAGAATTAADWAAFVLRLPAGRLWLGLLGAGVLAAGVFLARKAFVYPFDARLDRRALGPLARRWTVLAARAGTLVRAALIALCGGSMLQAAVLRDAARVADLAGGLEVLGAGTTGPLLLGLASAAFVGYGAYQLVKVRHRRLDWSRRDAQP